MDGQNIPNRDNERQGTVSSFNNTPKINYGQWRNYFDQAMAKVEGGADAQGRMSLVQ